MYEEGLAIITKHNVVKEDAFFISENKDTTYWKTRKIVSATIAYNGKNITFTLATSVGGMMKKNHLKIK